MPIVGCEPSCLLTLREEHLALQPGDERAETVAGAARLVEELLVEAIDAGDLRLRGMPGTRIIFHGHCHQKALTGATATMALLQRIPGAEVVELDAGCCGMAGSFGFEAEHYELSMQIGEIAAVPGAARRGRRHAGGGDRGVVPAADRARRGAGGAPPGGDRQGLSLTRWHNHQMADDAPHERRPRTPLPRDENQGKPKSFWRSVGGRFWALVLILLVLNYLSVAIFAPGREQSATIPYNPTFLAQVEARQRHEDLDAGRGGQRRVQEGGQVPVGRQGGGAELRRRRSRRSPTRTSCRRRCRTTTSRSRPSRSTRAAGSCST